MLLLYRFYRNREVAIRVVSTRRESGESFSAASLFKVKMSLVKNNEFEKKISIVSQIVWIILKIVKVISLIFYKGKNTWLTFY